jgi:FkbM family methyltransferase
VQIRTAKLLRVPKQLIRKSLKLLGYQIVPLAPEEPKRPEQLFAPSETNKFLWMSTLNINTVIDIGAHKGEFASKIRGILPDAAIFSFEPLEDVFRQLQINFKDAPNFKAFNCALADKNCQMNIFRNEYTPSSSLLPMTQAHKQTFPFAANEHAETIAVRRLDDVVCDLEVKEDLLVKMDVQGYEDKVIKGGEQVISRSRLLIVETSFKLLYESQPLFGQIYELLVQRGFRYIGSLEQLASPVDGTLLQADALFVKDGV